MLSIADFLLAMVLGGLIVIHKDVFIFMHFWIEMAIGRFFWLVGEGLKLVLAIFTSRKSYANEDEVVDAVFVDDDERVDSPNLFESIQLAYYRFFMNMLDKEDQATLIRMLDFCTPATEYDNEFVGRLADIYYENFNEECFDEEFYEECFSEEY